MGTFKFKPNCHFSMEEYFSKVMGDSSNKDKFMELKNQFENGEDPETPLTPHE